MNCHNCTQKTLNLFIRSFTKAESMIPFRQSAFRCPQSSRFFSDVRRHQNAGRVYARPSKPFPSRDVEESLSEEVEDREERPSWRAQKAALKEKLGGEAWNPRKKLSPDTMEGIRHLHATQPEKFTTPILADHFKVSPEAIRRILKSKWQPSDEEHEARMQRWDKRGERIWSNLVEMGVKPPKKWREMGVGRAENGERPRWKSRSRNLVDVRDSVNEDFSHYVPNDDIIPTVDGSGKSKPTTSSVPLSERL
ncbi:required for respiratory growth protein 9, mitochondrial [Clathrospora elynae]|uniref:Required for respiratory growth protein 9, mitochondrial n=1 Tax=Clathrospora elynae TaxID=706981 RepID=A0A6A5SX62_9PLEO|nr:required for respiratory growth protein 9, mitochondrial [Clathrospora elynae]